MEALIHDGNNPNFAKMKALIENSGSQSNGALMRVTPLAVWSSGFFDHPKELYKAVKNDVEFTHSNILVLEATFIYSAAIQYLLLHPEDPNRAFKAFDLALQWSKEHVTNYKAAIDSCEIWLHLSKRIADEAKALALGPYDVKGSAKLKE